MSWWPLSEWQSTLPTTADTVSSYDHSRIFSNRVRQYLRSTRNGTTVDRVDDARLDRILSAYDDVETVFVHAGLRDVKRAFGGNPYEFLLETLTAHFESVLAPGFTPTFRQVDGRVFHKLYSTPRHGQFVRQFLADADYRTDDPTNSILVKGGYRFGDCSSRDSFGENGWFDRLDRENVLYLNVGTDDLRCSHLHYVERAFDVPYHVTRAYEGVMYFDECSHEHVVHRTFVHEPPTWFNREKIQRALERAGVLDHYDLDGLRVSLFRAGDLRRVLAPRIRADPCYLVT